jgi:hypothetical protein
MLKEDIEAVVDRNYIFCRKSQLQSYIQSPNGKVKAEVRVLCTWKRRRFSYHYFVI